MNLNKTKFPLQLNKDICTACGVCMENCAYQAIQMNDYPVIDPKTCRLCGSCVRNCPSEALSIEETVSYQHDKYDENAEIVVLVEHSKNQIAQVTYELLGVARQLADSSDMRVSALLIGAGVQEMVDDLINCGADTVHVVDRVGLSFFIEENYAQIAYDIVRQLKPSIMLVGATTRGRGLSARLASMLHTGLTADCTTLQIDKESGLLQQVRPAFGGNLMATIVTPNHRPQMASVRPGVMQALNPDKSRTGKVIYYDDYIYENDKRISVVCEEEGDKEFMDLNQNKIIVGIGRGVKNKEMVAKIEEWAGQIGAAVAGSRAAVEAKLIDASRQIGQTGHTISPDLYIAIGISGQIQHTAAITGAKKIIAINPDRNAPIFRIADFGWSMPIEEALPQLMQTLNEMNL